MEEVFRRYQAVWQMMGVTDFVALIAYSQPVLDAEAISLSHFPVSCAGGIPGVFEPPNSYPTPSMQGKLSLLGAWPAGFQVERSSGEKAAD